MNQNNTTTFLQLAFFGIEIEIEIMQWKSNAKSKVKQIIHSRKCFPHDNFLDAEKRKNSKERSQARRVCVDAFKVQNLLNCYYLFNIFEKVLRLFWFFCVWKLHFSMEIRAFDEPYTHKIVIGQSWIGIKTF